MHTIPTHQIKKLLRKRCEPSSTLRPYIDNYLLVEFPAGDLPRLLPGTGSLCIFVLRGEALTACARHSGEPGLCPPAFLVCNRRQVVELSSTTPSRLLVVHVRSGRLRYFTDATEKSLQDQITDLHTLWGQKARDLTAALSAAENLAECAPLLSDFFSQHMRGREENRLDLLLDILHLSPETKIATLAEQSGLSLRQFERVFTQTYGITPMYFVRLSRLQKVARKVALNSGISALESALDAGFFDQSHFIHELKKLLGLSQAEFVQGIRGRPNFYNPKAIQWHTNHLHNMLPSYPRLQGTRFIRELLLKPR